MTNPYEDRIEKMRSLAGLWNLIHQESIPDQVRVFAQDDCIVIEVLKLEDLHIARHFLRETLGDWNDKLMIVWNGYGDTMLAEWKDHKKCGVSLWFRAPVSEFPVAAISGKDGCHIEEISEKSFRMVCKSNAT